MRRERDPQSGEETELVRAFVLVPVFDVSQTDGAPLAEPPAPAPLFGDSHARLLPDLERGAREAGYALERREALPRGTEGYVDHVRRLIVLADALPPNGQVAVLVHELAHVHGARYRDLGRAGAEVVAETAAYVALQGAGLDTGGQSVPYVAGWAEAAPREMAAYAEAVHRIAAVLERDLGLEQTRPEREMSPVVRADERPAEIVSAKPGLPGLAQPAERPVLLGRPVGEGAILLIDAAAPSPGPRDPKGRVYTVRRDAGAWIEVRERDGTVRRLRHRTRHSPTGLDWGYGGSAPADAALSILWDHLGAEPPREMYQAFKWQVVARCADGAQIGGPEISRWRALYERGNERAAGRELADR